MIQTSFNTRGLAVRPFSFPSQADVPERGLTNCWEQKRKKKRERYCVIFVRYYQVNGSLGSLRQCPRKTCLRTFGWKSTIRSARFIKLAVHPIKISGVRVRRGCRQTRAYGIVLFFASVCCAVCATLFGINSVCTKFRLHWPRASRNSLIPSRSMGFFSNRNTCHRSTMQ